MQIEYAVVQLAVAKPWLPDGATNPKTAARQAASLTDRLRLASGSEKLAMVSTLAGGPANSTVNEKRSSAGNAPNLLVSWSQNPTHHKLAPGTIQTGQRQCLNVLDT